jgi:hypothetical protein
VIAQKTVDVIEHSRGIGAEGHAGERPLQQIGT